MQDYRSVNQQLWNKRTATHLASDFYDVAGWLAGKSLMSSIELSEMGDISGKTVLHLQCHFGQDTLTMHRMGATVTGVDLSTVAIEAARNLASRSSLAGRFICSDIYDLPDHLDETFDIVFASYGTIGWLPDIDRWAGIVSRYLKPGGKLHFAEFHPVIWMYDDYFREIIYPYFNTGAIHEVEDTTYADQSAQINENSITWNHTISDVVTALLARGLDLIKLKEYDKSPFGIFKEGVEIDGWHYIKGLEHKLPLVYYLEARKPG